jgi:hypothetical protein
MRDKDQFLLGEVYGLISETPIDDIQRIGEWGEDDRSRKWDKKSHKLIRLERGIEKIKNLWSKTPQHFDIYLVNTQQAANHTEVGEVDDEFIKKELGINVPINHKNITVFYTNNVGNEKVPATGWTLAHRFGHAIRRSEGWLNYNNRDQTDYSRLQKNVDDLLQYIATNLYSKDVNHKTSYNSNDYKIKRDKEKIKRQIAHALGTFKSARDKNLRDYYEFTNELVAQYVINNKITFNKDFPRLLPMYYTWGTPQGIYKKNIDEHHMREIKLNISNYETIIYDNIKNMINNAVGKIFVM